MESAEGIQKQRVERQFLGVEMLVKSSDMSLGAGGGPGDPLYSMESRKITV